MLPRVVEGMGGTGRCEDNMLGKMGVGGGNVGETGDGGHRPRVEIGMEYKNARVHMLMSL